jgi:hypothetical protein
MPVPHGEYWANYVHTHFLFYGPCTHPNRGICGQLAQRKGVKKQLARSSTCGSEKNDSLDHVL